MEFLPYNTTGAVLVSQAGQHTRVANCNGFRATNTGDTVVWVNEQILFPGTATTLGDTLTVGGNLGEIYLGQIMVRFATPAGANPQVSIEQKYYMLPKQIITDGGIVTT